MSNVDTETAIVVGIGREGHLSDGTIAFVVAAARRLELGVELVHVVPVFVGGPTGTWGVGITFDQLVDEGRARLDEALARVRSRLGGDQPVAAELVRGGVIANLVERSRRAELVVLERRDLGRLQRMAEGSVTAAVAARAHCPVVSVPAGWEPPTARWPVTVAVEDAKRAAAELWTALGLAAAEDLPVQVLRVIDVPEAYLELLRADGHEELLRTVREELIDDARLPATVCERVPCQFVARSGHPVEVLLEASGSSSLLVVGRRDPRVPFGSHLGPTVRHLLRAAACPVLVVEPTLAPPLEQSEGPSTPAARPSRPAPVVVSAKG